MGTSVLSFLDVVENGGELYISGHDLRQSLEAAIAAKYSALWGNVPLDLPLADRSLALYPRAYRWLGGDHSGRAQTYAEALEGELFPSVFLRQLHLATVCAVASSSFFRYTSIYGRLQVVH